MDPLAIILAALLSAAHVPDGFACEVVEAGPAAIEILCTDDRTAKLRFVLIERSGVVVVDGRAL